MHDGVRDDRAENEEFPARLCLSLAPVPQLLWTRKEKDYVPSKVSGDVPMRPGLGSG